MMASRASGEENQRKAHLLDLPFEILQSIAWHLDVATFYVWLTTCKKLMFAAKDRRIILHHLRQLPGLRLGFETMSTLQLWDLFRKRAAESLCGAGALADIKSYASSHTHSCHPGSSRYKVSKPVFSFTSPAQIAMADDRGIVRVFTLDDHGVRLTSELHPPTVDLSNPPDVAVLKMAFSSNNDLAVLYQPLEPTKILEASPFYQRAEPAPLVVAVFRHQLSLTGDISYSTEEHEPAEIPGHDETECISLALAPNGNVCMGWLGPNLGERTHFWLILNKFREPTTDLDFNAIVIRDPSEDGRDSRFPWEIPLIFDVNFINGGKGINFYEAGNPIHSWFISSFEGVETDGTLTWQSSRNAFWIDLHGQTTFLELGMPFRGLHWDMNPEQTRFCGYTYHAIGITTTSSPASAFILASQYHLPMADCPHSVDLDRGRNRVDWILVAFLAGWRLGRSSLGTVMAVSPGGNGVAAATWDLLLIWTLDGDLLQNGTLRHYFPVRDYDLKRSIGRLRPTKLSTDGIGVIYSLRWASETSLFADTEVGLVQWDMSITSTGQRQTLSLDQEARPGNGVTLNSATLS